MANTLVLLPAAGTLSTSGHCKRYRAIGPHRATGPESTWT